MVLEDLAQSCLAYELIGSPGRLLRSAKHMLRSRPSSVRLYNAYAHLQDRLGDQAELEKVIVATLGKQQNATMQQDSIILWRIFIWKLLDNGRYATL